MSNEQFVPEYEPITRGFRFWLRDEVVLEVRWESEKNLKCQLYNKTSYVAPDVFNLGVKSSRDKLIQQAKDGFRVPEKRDEVSGKVVEPARDGCPHISEDIETVATILNQVGPAGETLQEQLKPAEGPSVTDRLISYARKASVFFHPPAEPRKTYAAVTLEEGVVATYEIGSPEFELWLRHEFWTKESKRLEAEAIAERESQKSAMGALAAAASFSPEIEVRLPDVIRDNALADAISQLKALASFDGKEVEVHTRIGKHEGKYYLDLANYRWQAVEIDAEGWRVVDTPPVRLVRSEGVDELPAPEHGGSLDDLRELLNLPDDAEGERIWALLRGWLVQVLRPIADAGDYPILALRGSEDSAKSTTSRMLKQLVDPNKVPDTGEPETKKDLYIDAEKCWILSFDNLSGIRRWLSDGLSRVSTGAGDKPRAFYTNKEQVLFRPHRPILMNGIVQIATAPDLLDRTTIIDLPKITKHRKKKDLWEDYYERRPKILGALLDAVVSGLNRQHDVDLPADTRLIDFASWATACEEGLGMEPGAFMQAYLGARADATQTGLESSPVAPYVWRFAQAFSPVNPWIGTMTQLLVAINESIPYSEEDVKRSSAWPKLGNKLSEEMNRVKASLSRVGVYFERVTMSNKDKRYKLYYIKPPEDGGDDTPPDDRPPDRPPQSGLDIADAQEGDDGTMGDDTLPFGESRVINIKSEEPYDTYIGREVKNKYYRLEESIWHNPYKEGEHGTLDEVIEMFERIRLPELLEDHKNRERLVSDVLGKVLACWCTPKRCHGEVLIKVAKQLAEGGDIYRPLSSPSSPTQETPANTDIYQGTIGGTMPENPSSPTPEQQAEIKCTHGVKGGCGPCQEEYRKLVGQGTAPRFAIEDAFGPQNQTS